METTPSPPSLVLRGRDSTARFEAGRAHVEWEHDRDVLRIPLEAIEKVRGSGRTVEIVLTTTRADHSGDMYAVDDASAAAVEAFTAAVRARLPERALGDPRPEGADLVTEVPRPRPRHPRRRAVLIAVGVCLAFDVVAAAIGYPAAVIVLPLLQLYGLTGVWMTWTGVRGLYDGWRLPAHGITVLAEFDHYTDKKKVYRYTDLDGASHRYVDGDVSGQQIEVSYDPREPGHAVVRPSGYAVFSMCLFTLLGLGLAGSALGIILHLFGSGLLD